MIVKKILLVLSLLMSMAACNTTSSKDDVEPVFTKIPPSLPTPTYGINAAINTAFFPAEGYGVFANRDKDNTSRIPVIRCDLDCWKSEIGNDTALRNPESTYWFVAKVMGGGLLEEVDVVQHFNVASLAPLATDAILIYGATRKGQVVLYYLKDGIFHRVGQYAYSPGEYDARKVENARFIAPGHLFAFHFTDTLPSFMTNGTLRMRRSDFLSAFGSEMSSLSPGTWMSSVVSFEVSGETTSSTSEIPVLLNSGSSKSTVYTPPTITTAPSLAY